jgi:hypothetical protein
MCMHVFEICGFPVYNTDPLDPYAEEMKRQDHTLIHISTLYPLSLQIPKHMQHSFITGLRPP